jgi:hypothetical protein
MGRRFRSILPVEYCLAKIGETMALKKAPSNKRGSAGAAKRSAVKKKTVGHAIKKSSRKAPAFKKAPRGTVVLGSGTPLSPYAVRALSVFSAGVQRALKQLAQRNIPAVVVENGRRIIAVPTKIDGRYVVRDVEGLASDVRATTARKRRLRVG